MYVAYTMWNIIGIKAKSTNILWPTFCSWYEIFHHVKFFRGWFLCCNLFSSVLHVLYWGSFNALYHEFLGRKVSRWFDLSLYHYKFHLRNGKHRLPILFCLLQHQFFKAVFCQSRCHTTYQSFREFQLVGTTVQG